MDEESLWGVCEHILIGSTNEALLRHDKIALCKLCTVILPVEDLNTVYESQLRDLIEDINIVVGVEYLDKKE